MKFRTRFNTIFYKLIISYTVLTIIITIILGISSNIYFSSNYKKELNGINQRILEQLSHTIDIKIIHFVEMLGFDVSTSQIKNDDLLFFFKNPISGNHSKLINASIYLREVANYNSDLVSSLLVYYIDNNIMISSSFGIKYLNSDDRAFYKELDFFRILDRTNNSYNIWLPTRLMPVNFDIHSGEENIISYIVRYPMTNRYEDQKGFIAINLRETTMTSIIESFIPPDNNNLFIIDGNGKIISHKDKSVIYKELNGESYIRRILENEKGYGSIIATVGKDKSIVSYIPLTNGWHLVNITSVNSFYSQAAAIQNMLIVMCVIAIFIGLVLTIFFTTRMYNPLKLLTTTVKSLFGETLPPHKGQDNEYTLINSVINDLSIKVTRMEDTLRDNQPVIKYSFVNALINNKIFSRDVLSERLKTLGMTLNSSAFTIIFIEISEGAVKNISHENIQFIKFDIIKMAEASSSETTTFIGAEVTDYRLAIIVSLDIDSSKEMLVHLSQKIADYVYTNYMLKIGVSFGDTVLDLLDIHKSAKKADQLLKYRFFMPERTLFLSDDLFERETSAYEIDSSIIEKLSKGLNLRNIAAVEEAMDKLMICFTEGPYSADHCKLQITNIMSLFSNYVRNMDYSSGKDRRNNYFYKVFSDVDNVYKFHESFISYVKDVFDYINSRSSSKTTEIIEKVQILICQSLSEDLSLDIIADKVNLSPRYLSKIFKDETNINFTDYVTLKRMEKAKDLILTTNKSVEQISQEVGYNNPAYFIRKFKETYGNTPGNFKKAAP